MFFYFRRKASHTSAFIAMLLAAGLGFSAANVARADNISTGDKHFAMMMGQEGIDEVKIANLGVEKASDPKVKEFAQTLVKDHTAANDELMKWANGNVNLPTENSSGAKLEYDRLSKLSGKEFDREFVKANVAAHKRVSSELKTGISDTKDENLKSWATKTKETVDGHLKMAEDLEKNM